METSEYRLRRLSKKCHGPAVIYISSEHFDESGKHINDSVELMTGVPYTFYELVVGNWDKYLTPWPADNVFSGRHFEGRAEELLEVLKTSIVPEIKKEFNYTKIYIAGYSLAGLFSLYSLYASDIFDGAACCSGSVWYPGWLEYVMLHRLRVSGKVYLSLGKREKNTKHPIMKNVEINMLRQLELLKEDPNLCMEHMDWHEGGHFDNSNERVAMGISWLIS